jgi:hypothetical protein
MGISATAHEEMSEENHHLLICENLTTSNHRMHQRKSEKSHNVPTLPPCN